MIDSSEWMDVLGFPIMEQNKTLKGFDVIYLACDADIQLER